MEAAESKKIDESLRVGRFCPYCGSTNIAPSPFNKDDVSVVCDDCKKYIWSVKEGLLLHHWALPIPNNKGAIIIPNPVIYHKSKYKND